MRRNGETGRRCFNLKKNIVVKGCNEDACLHVKRPSEEVSDFDDGSRSDGVVEEDAVGSFSSYCLGENAVSDSAVKVRERGFDSECNLWPVSSLV